MDRLRNLLPEGPARRAAILAAISLVLLVLTQFVFPGDSAAGRGTPMAILFKGLVNGALFSLTTVGVVVVYRTLRVINFAQTALGLAGANLVFGLVLFSNLPFPVIFVLGSVVAAVCGAAVGVVLLRFLDASRLVLTVVTIIGAGFLVQAAFNVYELPFFPDERDLTPEQASGAVKLGPYLPFPGWKFRVGDLPLDFGFAHVFAIEMAVLLLLATVAFFRYTRAGVAVRALAENPQRASLLGIGVGGMSILVWTIAGVLSGTSTMLTGMVGVPSAAGGFAPELLLTAFAAAAMARMERIPTAVAATFLLTTFSEAFRYSFPDDEALVSVLLFASLVAVLLLQGRSAGRAETGQAVTWSAVEEQRPVPRVLATIAAVRAVRWGLAAFGLLLLGVLPFIVPVRFVEQASVLCLAGIVTISIVVLTGWGGQVSLGQWGFAAVGATVGGALTATLGVPFWIAVPLAAVVTGGVAVAVGIPALRIPGLFLLPVTFAFAVAAQFTLFSDRYFGWLRPDKTVERPTLFFLDFRDGTSMYFLCLACLVLTIVLVGNLRRSRTGRILIALRENDANVQAFGVNVVRTKLLAFAISGALSGFAGAVFAHQQQGISFASYSPQRSVNAFIEAVFGGVGSVAGALLGAGFYIVTNYLSLSPVLRLVTDRGLPILLIFAAPAGIISLVNAARDSVLRVIAQRRQLIVPSLFADVDPDALEARLVPLAEAESTAGLAAIPTDERYVLASVLYRGRDGVTASERPSSEHAAIGGAVATLSEASQ